MYSFIETLSFYPPLLYFAVFSQLFIIIVLSFVARRSLRLQRELARELFGLTRKLEGLTSSRREQMVRHYDKLLADLSVRLPAVVADQASQSIFDTESKILSRLADLEPKILNDQSSKQKMDEIIRSMESLEQTLVRMTAQTVQKVMVENRALMIEREGIIELDTVLARPERMM